MNAKDEFGWRSIFKVYTSKDILKDSLVPILLSISMIITLIPQHYYKIFFLST